MPADRIQRIIPFKTTWDLLCIATFTWCQLNVSISFKENHRYKRVYAIVNDIVVLKFYSKHFQGIICNLGKFHSTSFEIYRLGRIVHVFAIFAANFKKYITMTEKEIKFIGHNNFLQVARYPLLVTLGLRKL